MWFSFLESTSVYKAFVSSALAKPKELNEDMLGHHSCVFQISDDDR